MFLYIMFDMYMEGGIRQKYNRQIKQAISKETNQNWNDTEPFVKQSSIYTNTPYLTETTDNFKKWNSDIHNEKIKTELKQRKLK